jgi:polysaccharide biosynthesis protein PslG
MIRNASCLHIMALILVLSLFAFIGCGDDDDDSDDASADDDVNDDADDDADDDIDDDSNDDVDDDADDDDTTLADPYAEMVPAGSMLDDILGISSHMHRGADYSWKREFEIEKLVEAGVKMVRTDFHWYSIEPEDDVWNLDGLDTMTDLCLAAGLDVTAIFLGSPDWATPGGTADEIDPAQYADYTGKVAEHFADRIDYYEFWNEQNTTRFWKPEPNPEKYGEILKATYEAVHANDPDASVIFGGMSPLEVKFFDPRGIWNFVYRVHEFHPDICDYFDVLSIHPYTFLQQPSPEFDLDLGIYHFPTTVGFIDLARSTLADIGCPDKRLQFTEMGWPSLIIGDQRQAAYLAHSMMLALANDIEIYDWYTFWDGSGGASLPTEDYFGLFTYPGDTQSTEAKESFLALRGAHRILGDSRYAGDLRPALYLDTNVYALVFADDEGMWTVALWRGGPAIWEEKNIVVPLPAGADGSWTLFDQSGDEIESGASDNREVEVAVTGITKYLQFPVSQ